MKTQSSKTYLVAALTVTLFLAGFLFIAPLTVIEAGPTLPPREPTPAQPEKDDDGDTKPVGAYIVLQNAPVGAWSVVQWQDINGDWQTVEGWQGVVNANGEKLWWVAQKDFGTGPFRWQVGDVTSAQFTLPIEKGSTLIVFLP